MTTLTSLSSVRQELYRQFVDVPHGTGIGICGNTIGRSRLFQTSTELPQKADTIGDTISITLRLVPRHSETSRNKLVDDLVRPASDLWKFLWFHQSFCVKSARDQTPFLLEGTYWHETLQNPWYFLVPGQSCLHEEAHAKDVYKQTLFYPL